MPRGEGSREALLRSVFVKRRALARRAAKRTNGCFHFCRGHFLSVACARRTRDRLLHQRAAKIVCAAEEAEFNAFTSHLHPGRLDVTDQWMQRETRNGLHQSRLSQGRASRSGTL